MSTESVENVTDAPDYGKEDNVEETENENSLEKAVSKIAEKEAVKIRTNIRHVADSNGDITKQITEINNWLSDDKVKVEFVDTEIARLVEEKKQISSGLLILLGEVEQHRSLVLVNKSIKGVFFDGGLFDKRALGYLEQLVSKNDKDSNFRLHKILDSLQTISVTVKNPEDQKDFERIMHEGSQFTKDVYDLCSKLLLESKNYLVSKHLQDIIDSISEDERKEGAITGLPGGASDETIYSYRRMLDSYRNRMRLGIHEGYPLNNMVLPISPGAFGFYSSGKLSKVFLDNSRTEEDADRQEKYYALTNNTKDDYIYREINNFPNMLRIKGSRYKNSSNGLMLLQNLWDFQDDLKRRGESFFFDLNQLNIDELHPVVVAEFLTKNEQYMHSKGLKGNFQNELSPGEFESMLFPVGGASEQAVYSYKNLIRLHMRKKIEDDFGFDTSELDLWTQRAFLEFLETRSIDDVDDLIAFTKKFGKNGFRTFLSVGEESKWGESILSLGEKLPEEGSQKLFEKYSEIVDTVSVVPEQLKEARAEDDSDPRVIVEI